jgi:hypothetical protein
MLAKLKVPVSVVEGEKTNVPLDWPAAAKEINVSR